jgi:hypothetical protein
LLGQTSSQESYIVPSWQSGNSDRLSNFARVELETNGQYDEPAARRPIALRTSKNVQNLHPHVLDLFSFSSRYRHLAATRRQKMLSGLSSVAVYEWLPLQMMCTTVLRSTGLQVLLNPNWAPSGLHCAVRLAVHGASASSPWRACRHSLVVYREFTSCPH